MKLEARFRLKRGPMMLDIELEARGGETVAVVGPNGAGKSSLLSAVAGLLRIDSGRVAFDDVLLDGGPGGAFVAPEDRRVGYVFQDHLLFPHLSVLDNVAYGLRSRGVGRHEAGREALAWLAKVGIEGVAEASPSSLSGGQAQRVALARALASRPDILLFDEPFAAIDASAKVELRRELRDHLAAFSGVRLIVAHDVIDALALADRVAVIEEGRLVQVDRVDVICRRPRSRYVADLIGTNLLFGRLDGSELEVTGGGRLVVPPSVSGDVLATVHPRAIALYRTRPEGTPRNVWHAPIRALETTGDRVRVQLGGDPPLVAEVTPSAVVDLGLAAGGDVWVAIKATEIGVYPA